MLLVLPEEYVNVPPLFVDPVFNTHTLPDGSISISCGSRKLAFWKPPLDGHPIDVVQVVVFSVVPVGEIALNVTCVGPVPVTALISATPHVPVLVVALELSGNSCPIHMLPAPSTATARAPMLPAR
jgi:hypothetical protein